MSGNITAVKIDNKITPIHLIESNMIEKDNYIRRKPLQGEYTSRGVIKTGTITSGTISCRLTNNTAPPLLYLITGKEIDCSHVPETRALFQRTLIPDYENPPEFSLIEITGEICFETPGLKSTGFTITQDDNSPLKLEIKIEGRDERAEIIKPEMDMLESSHFFYLPEPMKMQADFNGETIIKIDTMKPINEKPFYIEAYSKEKYEPDRYGKFIIQIENYQFEKILKKETGNNYYRHEGYDKLLVRCYAF